jgi:excisionase family DNA binding protein
VYSLPKMAETDLLTVEEVAHRSKLGEKAVRRAIRRGELRASNLCGRWRIRERDCEDWFDSGRVAGPAGVVLNVPPAPPVTGSLAALRQIEGETAA